MAAKNSKKSPALDMAAIIQATQTGSFVYTSPKAHAKALADGLVEINADITNDAGEFATRATEKGIESMNAPQSQAAPAAAKPSFAIESGVPLAPIVGRGRSGETYPFELLQVGQSFFVPNTEENKNVAKSLASTVSSATRRYAEEIPGETRVNKKGKTVPATKETRKFVVRAVDETAQGRGTGARVWRIA